MVGIADRYYLSQAVFDIVFESESDVEYRIGSGGEPVVLLKIETRCPSRCSALRRSRRCALNPVEEKVVSAAHHILLPGSERQPVPGASAIGVPDAMERFCVTIYVRKNPRGFSVSSLRTEGENGP